MRYSVKSMLWIVLLIAPFCLFAEQIQGNVVRVLDGDTIEVLQDRTPVRIRLINIDAPEKKQPFGRWSTNQLKSLIAGQPVVLRVLPNPHFLPAPLILRTALRHPPTRQHIFLPALSATSNFPP